MTIAQTIRKAAILNFWRWLDSDAFAAIEDFEPDCYATDGTHFRTFLLFVAEALEGIDSR